VGNLEKARFAFERLLELEPNNSMAMVALAIVELSTNINDYAMRQKAAKHLEQAFVTDKNNTLAMRYLADHYFI
jgi:RNA polymerase-associated protein CTR9